MNDIYDVIIIGGGPAGLSAAIYMARAQFSVLVLEKDDIGGQIQITNEIVNYPGIERITGKELGDRMRIQAESFGAEFLSANVTKTNLEGPIKSIQTDRGTYESIGVILATGANPRKLGFEGESKFQGRGVAYCATCDGEFFTNLDVFVIGGGFAAAEEAMFLTKYARKVHIIVREEDFLCAKSIADEVKQHDKIEVSYETEIIRVEGDQQLKKATFRDNKNQREWDYVADPSSTFGVFVFAGYVPSTSLFKDVVSINDQGYVITDENRKTNLDGVYAAGDVCVKNLRQVVTAVSDGAIAATSLERYIPNIVKEQSLKTKVIKKSKIVKQLDTSSDQETNRFISDDISQQLKALFQKLEQPMHFICNRNSSELSQEIDGFIKEFQELSNHFTVSSVDKENIYPGISFETKKPIKLTYHLVPGGHEFNSFVMAVYNAAGPKQPLDDEILAKIKSIDKNISIKVLVSLSCTMCPETVMAAQRISIENEHVETDVFDISHFPELKKRYNVMSVPCVIVNEETVSFGRKDISQMLELLDK